MIIAVIFWKSFGGNFLKTIKLFSDEHYLHYVEKILRRQDLNIKVCYVYSFFSKVILVIFNVNLTQFPL